MFSGSLFSNKPLTHRSQWKDCNIRDLSRVLLSFLRRGESRAKPPGAESWGGFAPARRTDVRKLVPLPPATRSSAPCRLPLAASHGSSPSPPSALTVCFRGTKGVPRKGA